MTLAKGEGQESLGGEKVKCKGLTCTILPRDFGCTSLPACMVSSPGAEKRVMLMYAMACASERRIPKGRFPTRPRFFPGVRMKAVFLCALEGGGWGGCHGNIAWNTHLPNIQPQRT